MQLSSLIYTTTAFSTDQGLCEWNMDALFQWALKGGSIKINVLLSFVEISNIFNFPAKARLKEAKQMRKNYAFLKELFDFLYPIILAI